MNGGGTLHKAHRGPAHAGFSRKPRHEMWTTVTISDSTVAIIGTGNIVSRLAANFADGGQDFLLAGRDQEAARTRLQPRQPQSVSINEAIERADALVFAVWLDPFRELIAYYGERLADKVIADPTNPIRPERRRPPQGHRRAGILGPDLAGLLPTAPR